MALAHGAMIDGLPFQIGNLSPSGKSHGKVSFFRQDLTYSGFTSIVQPVTLTVAEKLGRQWSSLEKILKILEKA